MNILKQVSFSSKRLAKFLGTGIIASGLLVGTVMAHTPSPEEFEERREQIIERLDLTPEQQVEVEAIFDDMRAEFQMIMDEYGVDNPTELTREQRREVRHDMKELQEQSQDQLKAVLTDEQIDEFKEIRKEMHDAAESKKKERRR